jgi:Fur family ferric uptake transcriptional regulator
MARFYNTRQGALVLEVLRENGSRPRTAEDLMKSLKGRGEKVGKTTLYRQLNKLGKQGKLRVTMGPGGTGYQYVEDPVACAAHMHCRCCRCGKLFHVDCSMLRQLSRHLLSAHAFVLDPVDTVLQGTCKKCEEENGDGAAEA